jgi:hypothetical protein
MTESRIPSSPDARIAELLEELVTWTRFASREPFIRALRETLKDSKQWRAYEATDGVRSQAEVAAASSLSQPAISALWAKWRRQGIVVERGRRPSHLASPSDLGIEIPGEDNARVGESAG